MFQTIDKVAVPIAKRWFRHF